MRRPNRFRHYLIILAFVILPLAGYFTVSNVTSCQAQSCACGGDCVAGLDASISSAASMVSGAMTDVASQLLAFWAPLVTDFNAGIHPVLDWTLHQLATWFETFWFYSLQPTMQTMTRQLNVANAEQSFALGAFADAANAVRAKDVLGDFGLQDHRSLRPNGNVCTAGTMLGGMIRADGFSDGFNAAAAAGKLWRSANVQGYPSSAGAAMDRRDRWSTYITHWCNKDYNGGHAGCDVTQAMAGQDVDPGLIFAQDTINLAPSDPTACASDATKCTSPTFNNMQELITNLAEPFVKDPVTASPQDAKAAILQSISYKTKRQVVYDGLYYVVSRRVPANLPPDFINYLRQMRRETGEDIPGLSPNPSRNEVLRAMMTQRFRTGKYSVQQLGEPENTRREMVINQALQLMQMSDELDMMDHYSLLLASQVSAEVEREAHFSAASEGAPVTNQ